MATIALRAAALASIAIAIIVTATSFVVWSGTSASEQVIETLIVPTDGSSVSSATTLESGVLYALRASRTFFIGTPGDGMADAEYSDFSNPPSSLLDEADGVDGGITVNNVHIDRGVYQPTHVYSIGFVGQGAPISLRYLENNYPDNSGTLCDGFRLEPGCHCRPAPSPGHLGGACPTRRAARPHAGDERRPGAPATPFRPGLLHSGHHSSRWRA